MVGLKLDVRLVRRLGPVALATGMGQVIFTSVIGFAIAIALGFGSGGDDALVREFAGVVGRGVILLVVVLLAGRYVAPRVTNLLDPSPARGGETADGADPRAGPLSGRRS